MLYLGQELKHKNSVDIRVFYLGSVMNDDVEYVIKEYGIPRKNAEKFKNKGGFLIKEVREHPFDSGDVQSGISERYYVASSKLFDMLYEPIRNEHGKIIPGDFIIGNCFFGILKKEFSHIMR
jgi:hypothetical protein